MRSLIILQLISLLLPGWPALPLFQDSSPNVDIHSPVGGEAVQGAVPIQGSANPVDFASYELAFAYHEDPKGTWFLIAEGDEPVRNAILAEWDTFSITDGVYDLRLQVILTDGSLLEFLVAGVRVRNYSLVETLTPTPPATATGTPTPDLTAMFTPSSTPTETPTASLEPSVTPFPPNPAELQTGSIPLSLARGAAGALVVLILLGIYTSIRSPRRK